MKMFAYFTLIPDRNQIASFATGEYFATSDILDCSHLIPTSFFFTPPFVNKINIVIMCLTEH